MQVFAKDVSSVNNVKELSFVLNVIPGGNVESLHVNEKLCEYPQVGEYT